MGDLSIVSCMFTSNYTKYINEDPETWYVKLHWISRSDGSPAKFLGAALAGWEFIGDPMFFWVQVTHGAG